MLAEQHPPGAAAVASEAAATIYGGKILRRNIEDNRKNFTRFFLLTKQKKPLSSATGAWKTSVAFCVSNQPGALFKVMACFALRDLNLTKIESRPLPGKPWEYLFYVDFVGSSEDKVVQRCSPKSGGNHSIFPGLGKLPSDSVAGWTIARAVKTSNVVIQSEFVRMRTQADRFGFGSCACTR